MTLAPEPKPESTEQELADEARRLIASANRMADVVQRYARELVDSHRDALQARRIESTEIVGEAMEEAKAMLARAEHQARATLDEAVEDAARITSEARTDTQRLTETSDYYRATLEAALRAHDGLERLSEPREEPTDGWGSSEGS